MTKTDFIKGLAEYGCMTQNQAREIFELLHGYAVSELNTNGEFGIHDLVQVKVVDVPERTGVALGHKWVKPAGKQLKAKIIGRGKRMFDAGA